MSCYHDVFIFLENIYGLFLNIQWWFKFESVNITSKELLFILVLSGSKKYKVC